jgi:hypothetical protein
LDAERYLSLKEHHDATDELENTLKTDEN